MKYKLTLTCFLFFLAGCTSIPEMKRDSRVQHVSLTQVEEKTGVDPVFTKGDFPEPDWWKMFQDEQLTHVIEEALKENPTLKKAEAKIGYASEIVKLKRSFLFPTLGLQAQSNWMYYGQNSFFRSIDPTIPAYIDQIDVGPTLNYEFDFWGKNRHMFKAALGLKKVEQAESASATLMITTLLTQTYFTIQRDLETEVILKELYNLKLSFLQLTSDRKKQGVATELEILKARQNLEAIREVLAENQKMIETDHFILDGLTGQSPGFHTLKIAVLSLEDPFPLPQTIALDLVARRPDLVAQIWRVESIAHEIGAARADFYPNIDLNIFAGFESLHFDTLFSPKSYLYTILPAIHLPIFNAGRIKANLKSKKAKFDEAIFSYNETLLKAAQDVADGIAAVKWISKEIDHQIKILDALQAQLILTESRFCQGLDTTLEVITAKESFYLQKLKLIDGRHALILAKIRLIKALGGGFDGR